MGTVIAFPNQKRRVEIRARDVFEQALEAAEGNEQ